MFWYTIINLPEGSLRQELPSKQNHTLELSVLRKSKLQILQDEKSNGILQAYQFVISRKKAHPDGLSWKSSTLCSSLISTSRSVVPRQLNFVKRSLSNSQSTSILSLEILPEYQKLRFWRTHFKSLPIERPKPSSVTSYFSLAIADQLYQGFINKPRFHNQANLVPRSSHFHASSGIIMMAASVYIQCSS